MAKTTLTISPSARRDLINIQSYGLRKWGKATTQSYMANLHSKFKLLFNNPQLGMERPELGSNLRNLFVNSHIIFYRYRKPRIEIVRILHKRQDPNQNL